MNHLLDMLNQVDWPSLSHAYGAATDVPAWLKAMQSNDSDNFQDSYRGFCDAVLHQGDLYDSTVASVPFLMELAEYHEGEPRHRILCLLYGIAFSYHESILNWKRLCERHENAKAHRDANEPICLAAFQAVCRTVPQILVYLKDEAPSVRRAAALVLANCEYQNINLAEELWKTSQSEHDPTQRARAIFTSCLYAQRQQDQVEKSWLVERLNHELDEHPATEVVAACALSLLRLGVDESTQLKRLEPLAIISEDLFLDWAWDDANDLYSLINESITNNAALHRDWIRFGLKQPASLIGQSAILASLDHCNRFRNGMETIGDILITRLDEEFADSPERLSDYWMHLWEPGEAKLRHASKQPSQIGRSALRCLADLDRQRTAIEQSFQDTRPFFLGRTSWHIKTIKRLSKSHHIDDEHAVRRSITRLRHLGARASEALPVLRSLIEHHDQSIAIQSVVADWFISGEATYVVPRLMKVLQPRPSAIEILQCLRQIGGQATPALPELLKLASSNERFFQFDCRLPAVSIDDWFRQECQITIDAINADYLPP